MSEVERQIEELLDRGDAAFEDRNMVLAHQEYSAALELDNTHMKALLKRAVVLRRQGELRAALADYLWAEEIDPEERRIYVGRAAIREDMRDFIGAVKDYERALALTPKGSSKTKRITSALEKARLNLGSSEIRGQNLKDL